MGIQLVWLAVALVCLFIGAEGLVRGGASLARRFGLSPLMIGLTVVAYGTSAPEMVVSIGAALDGRGDVVAGNVVGSNSFNIGVILGITALLCPIKTQWRIVKLDAPLMIGVAVLGAILLWDGRMDRWEGALLFATAIAYTVLNLVFASKTSDIPVEAEFAEGMPPRSVSVWWDLGYILGGLFLLVLGSNLLVASASEIARGFGVSEAVIGLTIVAAGTSMPELATSVLAALRKQPDIAVGNIVGSNVFNVLGILGVTSLATPFAAGGLSVVDYVVMLAFSVSLLPMLWTGLLLRRLEGLALLTGYGGYLWWIWP